MAALKLEGNLTLAILFSLLICFPLCAFMGDWQEAGSKHFILYHKQAENTFITQTLKEAEKYYALISKNLGADRSIKWTAEKRAKIYIFEDASHYKDILGQPEWSDASSIMRLRVIFSYIGAKRFLETTLPHEIGHIIFKEMVGFDNRAVPAWLEEGVAALHENIDTASLKKKLATASRQNDLLALAEVSWKQLRLSQDETKIDLFYAQSQSIVRYLLDNFASRSFSKFCAALRDKNNFNGALKQVYGFKDTAELEQAWKRDTLAKEAR